MPVLDEATHIGRKAGSLPATISTSNGTPKNIPNGITKPAAAPLVDLLDLISDDALVASSSGNNFLQDLLGVYLSPASSQSVLGSIQTQNSGTDVLMDLLSIGTPPSQSNSSVSDILSSTLNNTNQIGSLEGLSSPSAQVSSSPGGAMLDLLDGFGTSPRTQENNGSAGSLKLMFDFSKPPGNPQSTVIKATFTNKSPNAYTDFIFQAAVPKFLQLHMEPASGNILGASGNGSLTQDLKVTNSQHGTRSLVMRIRISYKNNNQDVLEEGQINNFPRGL